MYGLSPGFEPVLSGDVLHAASSVSLYKNAGSTVHFPTLIVAFLRKYVHRDRCDTWPLESLEFFSVLLRDAGTELEGDVFVVSSTVAERSWVSELRVDLECRPVS